MHQGKELVVLVQQANKQYLVNWFDSNDRIEYKKDGKCFDFCHLL